MRENLTEAVVARQKSPKNGERLLRDTEIRGFGLRTNWGGVKSFFVECKVRGQVRRMGLGRWPVLGVVAARAKALDWKRIALDGGDPRLKETAADVTFEQLTARYLEHAKTHGKKTWRQDEGTLALYVPKWNKRRLVDIDRGEVVKLHEDAGRDHGHYAANRLIALLRTMFNCAIDWKLFGDPNPAARVKMFKEKKRKRFLSPDELGRVNQALMDEPNEYWRAFFAIAPILGPRRGELLSAKWADIDFAEYKWRLPMTKNGEEHLLPLVGEAASILEKLPRKSEWIFPSYGRTGHLVEPKKAWQRIRDRAGVPDVRIHDLRRTLGSWLAAANYGLPMIGAALNHSSPASTAVYARLALDPIRTMLEANAMAMVAAMQKPTEATASLPAPDVEAAQSETRARVRPRRRQR